MAAQRRANLEQKTSKPRHSPFGRLSLFSTTVGGAAIILGTASLASRGLGLLRDRLLATGFGAGSDLDVYYAAFRIPDFLFNILIWGAISAAFIPVFAGYLAGKQRETANQVASTVLSLALLTLLVAVGLVWIFAAQVMPLVAPGFTPEQLEKLVELTRVMLLSPIFFGMSGIFGSILQSNHKFVAFATAPLFYNLGIIGGALAAPRYGLVWLAVGVVAGAFLQMLVQLAAVSRTGFRYRPRLDLHHPGVRRILLLMVPATIGIAIVQINWLVETVIATTLREGSLAQFMLATSLSMLPVGVVGASLATAIFPVLAKAASQKRDALFTSSLVGTIRQILYFVIPAAVAMMLLRAQIVRLVYGSGKFDFADTRFVTSLLGILAVSLFAQALIPLLTRAFYALRNTRTPVVISAFAMVLNIVLALVLSHYYGVVGLGFAFSVASIVQVALLFFFLSVKVPSLEDGPMLSAIGRILAASAVMGASIYGALYGVAYVAEHIAKEFTVAYFVLQSGVAVVVGSTVYIGLTLYWKLPEAQTFVSRLRRRVSRAVE